MNQHPQIDEALRLIGNAPPPEGMERRIHAGLDAPRRGFSTIHSISAIAIAASISIGALAISPGVRDLALHNQSASPAYPRIMVRSTRAFGGVSAAHVPAAPVPVQPVPVTQGRGHSRSARGISSPGTVQRPLPRGVGIPHELQSRVLVLPASQASATTGR